MWTKDAVDAALKSYADDKARSAHLEIEIAELTRRVNTAAAALASDEAGPRAQQITGMPHGTTVGNPTAQIAEKLASGWLPPEVKDMKRDLSVMQEEHARLSARVKFVEAWLEALTEREHWIILHQFVRQEYWRDVLNDYEARFGGYVAKDALKGLRAKALKRIYAIAGIRN